AMIDEGVTAVLAARATTRNGDDRLHEMSTLILQGYRRSGRLDLMVREDGNRVSHKELHHG
ncbi:hypothetical protein Tco_0338171, partial [Tanacetum coccineum]